MQPIARATTGFLELSAFLSGAAALVYEIVFARHLALFLGHGGYAVLAASMQILRSLEFETPHI